MSLYVPMGHWAAVALVEPAGQKYPALHLPLHVDAIMPVWLPKYPLVQPPHTVAPPVLYVPTGHIVVFSEVVEGLGQE